MDKYSRQISSVENLALNSSRVVLGFNEVVFIVIGKKPPKIKTLYGLVKYIWI